jgi:membrane-associated phospholipid phosphatase
MKCAAHRFGGVGLLFLVAVGARADFVLDWNAAFLAALRNETTPPPLASRNLAILHTSIYDAVNSIAGAYTPYKYNVGGYDVASREAAALGAAYQVSLSLYPSQRSTFDALYGSGLQQLGGGAAVQSGLELGRGVANAMLNWRVGDGSSTTVPYIPGTAPGDWRRTPPFFRPPESPQWQYVEPFALESGSMFRPSGPPAFGSEEWVRDYNMVKELGSANSTTRTADQTQIARFWSDFSYTVTPPGHWNQIAEQTATTMGNDLLANARLFAMLNVAMADAAIAVWDAKYVYNFWRPVTAIPNGDSDGNDLTVADPGWLPLLATPSFPEYVSGHSTFSSAAAEVLAFFYGTDRMTFTIGSDALPGVFRTYESFGDTAYEIGMSRIYGGIHFLSGDLDGLELGSKIGEYVTGRYFQVVPEPRPVLLFAFAAGIFLFCRARRERR